jgi:tetratricopeptide (TPR) repeat protein
MTLNAAPSQSAMTTACFSAPSPQFSRFFSVLKTSLASALRWLLLALSLTAWHAQADDYSSILQLQRSGQLAQALSQTETQLLTKPRDPQLRFLKGVLQRDLGQLVQATDTFTQLIREYPELPEPYNNLAVLYAQQNQFDKAKEALEMAIRNNPGYAVAHENLGDVYAKLASLAYSQTLQLDPTNASVTPKLNLLRQLLNPTGKN